MTIRKAVSSFLARLALIGLLVTPTAAAVVLAPAPAYAQVTTNDPANLAAKLRQMAQDAWNAAKEIAVLGNILSGIQSLYSTVTDMFGRLFDKIDLQTAIRTATDNMRMRADVKMHDDLLNANWWLGRINGQALISSEDPLNPAALMALCRKEMAKQTSNNAGLYQANRVAAALAGLDASSRLIGDPIAQHAATAFNRREAGAVNKSDTGKNNARASRHAAEEADLDMSATSLIPSLLREAYEEPSKIPLVVDGKEIKANGETVYVYDFKDNIKNQRYFRYAYNYCYNMSGPEKVPPQGSAADVPAGISAWGGFTQCAAMRSMFRQPCFEAVYYLTRPNCSDPDNAELCKQSKKLCEEAKARQDLPPSFGDCSKPLSKYQTDYLQHIECMSGTRYTTLLGAGMSQAQALPASDICLTSYETWMALQKESINNLMSGIRGILEARDCKY